MKCWVWRYEVVRNLFEGSRQRFQPSLCPGEEQGECFVPSESNPRDTGLGSERVFGAKVCQQRGGGGYSLVRCRLRTILHWWLIWWQFCMLKSQFRRLGGSGKVMWVKYKVKSCSWNDKENWISDHKIWIIGEKVQLCEYPGLSCGEDRTFRKQCESEVKKGCVKCSMHWKSGCRTCCRAKSCMRGHISQLYSMGSKSRRDYVESSRRDFWRVAMVGVRQRVIEVKLEWWASLRTLE